MTKVLGVGLVVAAGCALGLATAAAQANPVSDLAGYWTGTGSVVLTNGNTEQVKCAVIYKVSPNGREVKQSLRCASPAYNINAAAELQVNSGAVSGKWEEKNYSQTGDVTGKLTDAGFSLAIKGLNFSAAMNVNGSACKQSINITPQGTDVTKITIGLGKC
jgi:hypothetical protein